MHALDLFPLCPDEATTKMQKETELYKKNHRIDRIHLSCHECGMFYWM